jgi:hypothetical protein
LNAILSYFSFLSILFPVNSYTTLHLPYPPVLQGKQDAKANIDNLTRDKSGNIIETIKMVTHSMGGTYGKGFMRALKQYIATLPEEQQKQIRISFVIDFDPNQGGDITADGDIPTFQSIHYGGSLTKNRRAG